MNALAAANSQNDVTSYFRKIRSVNLDFEFFSLP